MNTAAPDPSAAEALLNRAYEVVHHEPECPSIGGNGDKDCKCDAVPFLRDLKAALSAPAAAVGGDDADPNGWVANFKYLLERCPHTVRHRQGGGAEDLLQSAIITFMGMERKLEATPAAPVGGFVVGGWKPIVTAPVGVPCLVYAPASDKFDAVITVAKANHVNSHGDGWELCEAGGYAEDRDVFPYPTHWKPIGPLPGIQPAEVKDSREDAAQFPLAGPEPKWRDDIECVIYELKAGRPEIALKHALHIQSVAMENE